MGKSLVLHLSLLVALVVQVQMAAIRIDVKVDPNRPNECFTPDWSQQYLAVGDSYAINCIKYSCHKDKRTEQLYIVQAGCGFYRPRPHCELEEDNSKPYPECCPREKCPEGYD